MHKSSTLLGVGGIGSADTFGTESVLPDSLDVMDGVIVGSRGGNLLGSLSANGCWPGIVRWRLRDRYW